MFWSILHLFMVVWWVKKYFPIIPRHNPDQINQISCAQAPYFFLKVMIIEDFPSPSPKLKCRKSSWTIEEPKLI